MTLSPCSQLHARLADDITVTAGRLLPYPFTPYPVLPIQHLQDPAGILSVAVVVNPSLPRDCPHLRFRGATLLLRRACPPHQDGSREVPLPTTRAGSDSFYPPVIHVFKLPMNPAHRQNRHRRFPQCTIQTGRMSNLPARRQLQSPVRPALTPAGAALLPTPDRPTSSPASRWAQPP